MNTLCAHISGQNSRLGEPRIKITTEYYDHCNAMEGQNYKSI